MVAAAGCTRLNASHCGNQAGDLTCQQRDPSTPHCDVCEAVNDGCVASEPACGLGSTSSSGEPGEGSSTAASVGTSALDETVAASSGEPPSCGNGALDPEEACDGTALPAGTSCVAMGYGEGTPGCAADCTAVDYSMCPDYVECGNGEVAADEQCDGDNLAGMTCGDFANLTGPGLVCTDRCAFDTSACLICRENEQSCSQEDLCCDPEADCKFTLMGNRCCGPNTMGLCL